MTGDRIPCSAPGCGRSRRADPRYDEWLCQIHWPLVSAKTRRTLNVAKRRKRWRLMYLAWDRAKREVREAIEMGAR